MHQATDSGWYAREDGSEIFIQKGTVRPDNHDDVKAVPALFEKLAGDEPKAEPKKAPKS